MGHAPNRTHGSKLMRMADMPKKRPGARATSSQAAKLVVDIASGQVEDASRRQRNKGKTRPP